MTERYSSTLVYLERVIADNLLDRLPTTNMAAAAATTFGTLNCHLYFLRTNQTEERKPPTKALSKMAKTTAPAGALPLHALPAAVLRRL